MNKRAVNISSLVILLALLSLILEICLYYFIPQHVVTVIVAAVISLGLTHFFLETSLDYDYCFLYAALMTITSLAFCIVVYLMQPNQWIQYDYTLLALIIVNWFIPFAYCFIRDFIDRGPRFADYLFFFHGMSILFLAVYLLAIVKQLFVTPFLPPYDAMSFGAHNFVPFMATGSYVEAALASGSSLHHIIVYLAEMIVIAIPFGFYAKVYCRSLPFLIRLFVYLAVPFLMEAIQYLTGIGRADIDDYTLALIGTVIGIIIYHIIYRISYETHKRDFLEERTVTKSLIFHFNSSI
jgi:glycopeptide antibiotics resistance protein